jgi:hypothetical protein
MPVQIEIYRKQGKFKEALAAVDNPKLRGSAVVGIAYASMGQRREALNILKEVTRPGSDPLGTAFLYFALGDKDRGFE